MIPLEQSFGMSMGYTFYFFRIFCTKVQFIEFILNVTVTPSSRIQYSSIQHTVLLRYKREIGTIHEINGTTYKQSKVHFAQLSA